MMMRNSMFTLCLAFLVSSVRADEIKFIPIAVELREVPPLAVAASQAKSIGAAFDEAKHQRMVMASQDAFLANLRRQGIAYRITETNLKTAQGDTKKPHRFVRLINAIGLEVPEKSVDAIRGMPAVAHVTLDEPLKLNLDHSVEYVRANDGPGNKSIFTQGGGPLTRFDGSGQVIAVFDTGIEHSNPMFDTRFSDADFLQRTGDTRPVRLAGQPYQEGVHHPKIVYFLPLTGSTNEDDVGHGTHCSGDAAGLKVKAPGLDRLPDTDDDQIIEGVAPGALLMNYKVCETIFTCVGLINVVTALEDAMSPTDAAGFPKPVATVVNMSLGGGAGDPNDANAVAAGNAALLGAVVVAAAGNSGSLGENSVGSPCAGRRVFCVGASNDPGTSLHQVDVLPPDPVRYSLAGVSTGAQDDTGRPTAPEDLFIHAIIMGGSPNVPYDLGQHYVYVGLADTPDQVPDAVNGRIGLAVRGSTVDGDQAGTGLFGHKAAEVAAKGGVALLVFNNVDGELEAVTTQQSVIPAFGLSKANGEYLRDMLGFQSASFNKDDHTTWNTISNFPVRINLPAPNAFVPATTGFSSRGPVQNFQYVKPDVLAPGFDIYGPTIPAGGLQVVVDVPPGVGGTMSDPARFISASGTSFACPTTAGAAALIRHALLALRGETPLDGADLRSGADVAAQQAQFPIAPVSLVRSALTNSATNLREGDNLTPVPDTDPSNLIHDIGSGLIHVQNAADMRAAMGTNDANGPGGPDDANHPDFLPTHSFGSLGAINTDQPNQVSSVTVTLQNLSGVSAGGTYTLSLLDGGELRGDVTRPIVGTTGFSLSLSTPSVSLGNVVNDQAAFDVVVSVDGRPAPDGLAVAGTDVTGVAATEFLWWVVATGSNGQSLRMPFYYRATAEGTPPPAQAPPFQNAVADDATPDQVGGVDRDGSYVVNWTFPPPPNTQPCGFQVEEATTFATGFTDDAEEALVAGSNSKWTGGPTWSTQQHPVTGTNSYSPLYIDNQDASLTLVTPVTLPGGVALSRLTFDSFEDLEETFDFGNVEVSADGGEFLVVAAFTGAFSGRRALDLSGFAGQEVVIRFRLVSDLGFSSPVYQGWFIDNIAIETANFSILGTASASTLTFPVSGRSNGDYFYRVAGLFGDACDEVGPYSLVRQITVNISEGNCDADPIFAGLQSVSVPLDDTCSLDLAWSTAVTDCPGATVSYNIYRSTDSGFMPALTNLIALGVNGLTYHDQAGLYHGTTYYYVVRAEDSQTDGGGPNNGGNEDDNIVRLGGSPLGPATPSPDFADDVEPSSEPGYTTTNTRLSGDWLVTPDSTAHSPNNAWVVLDEQPGVPGIPKDATLVLPSMNLGSSSTMSFWHNFDFAQFLLADPATAYQSGGVLEISDDGVTWADLGPYVTSGGYNGSLDPEAQSPLAGRPAWVGSSDDTPGARTDAMSQVTVDLGAAMLNQFGATEMFGASIRFRMGGTFQVLIDGTRGVGWGVDDLFVTGLIEPGPCVTQTCGDAIVDAGEQCDAGAFNSDTQPDTCRTDCTVPSCGDGVRDTGERCDDGNLTNGDGCSAACDIEVATPQADPSGIDKCRFISFVVPPSNVAGLAVSDTALRVRLVSLHHVEPPYTGGPSVPFTSMEGQERWVGPPTQYVESTSNNTAFHAASLQCDPYYQDWTTVGLLHVTGSAVVPSSSYEVQSVASVCAGAETGCTAVSSTLTVRTNRWGDIEVPYNPPTDIAQPDLADVSALVNKFRSAPGAPIKARALLAGSDTMGNIVIDQDTNFMHIAACVGAFRGESYPFAIQSCP